MTRWIHNLTVCLVSASVLWMPLSSWASVPSSVGGGDRAVQIARQSLDRVPAGQIDEFIAYVFVGRDLSDFSDGRPGPLFVAAQQNQLVTGLCGDLQRDSLTDGTGRSAE